MDENIILISELKEVGRRFNIFASIDSISANISKNQKQEGVLSDQTGVMRFVVWANSKHRYLKPGKKYFLMNVKLNEYMGKLEIQIDKKSSVKSEEHELIKCELEKIKQEKDRIARQKEALAIKEQEIKAQLENIDHDKKVIDAMKYVDDKSEIKREKVFTMFAYILFSFIIVASGLYIYDFMLKRVIPRVNDIVEIIFGEEKIPYKVVENDKKNNIVTLESLDEYKEEISFERPMNIEPPNKDSKNDLKKHTDSKSSKIYSYNMEKSKKPLPYVNSKRKVVSKPLLNQTKKVFKQPVKKTTKEKTVKTGVLNRTVHINSETSDAILMKLPGIGPRRVAILKDSRPYHSVEDILNAKIGIGAYWVQKWKEGIEAGLIAFD